MKLTRERKILAGVLAAGLLALVIDQAGSGGAHSEATKPEEAAVAPAKQNPVASTPGAPSGKPEASISLARRIALLAEADRAAGTEFAAFRDPFQVSRRWSGAGGGDPAETASHVAQTHRLTAVIVAGNRSSAVIDGSLVRVGQIVGGQRLVAVTQDMAILEAGDSRMVLRLEQNRNMSSADVR